MKEMNNEVSIKKNTLFNIIKTVSAIIFPLITFPYVSRVLGAEGVGKVNFAQSFVNYFSLIAGLGLSTYAVRECTKVKENQSKLSKLASQMFSINLITTVIAYFIMGIVLLIVKDLKSYSVLICIESMSIIFVTVGADWLNAAMEDFKYITIRTIIFQVISLLLMFVFVRNEIDYVKYAIISVISISGANLANVFYRKKYCKIYFTKSINWENHMKPIMLLFVMMLSQTIFNNADITMLGLMKGDYEVGLYSTSYKLIRIIQQIVSSVALVIIPPLSRYFASGDFRSANALLRKILAFNITVGLPCVVGVIMMADEILYIVGGVSYIGAAPIIRILVLSFMFSLVGGSFLGNAVLIPMQKEGYYMVICLITAGFNVVINALLIPGYGAIGAAIATAMNGFIVLILLLLKVDHRVRIKDVKSVILGPVIGCLFIAFVCMAFSGVENLAARTFLSIFVSIIVYLIAQILLKNEIVIENLKAMIKKIKRKGA